MVDKIVDALGEVEGKTIAVLGITFKPNTDDMREAPSLVILPELVKYGIKLKVYDPKGREEGTWRLHDIKDNLIWCEETYEAITNTDATLILTEWNEFRSYGF